MELGAEYLVVANWALVSPCGVESGAEYLVVANWALVSPCGVELGAGFVGRVCGVAWTGGSSVLCYEVAVAFVGGVATAHAIDRHAVDDHDIPSAAGVRQSGVARVLVAGLEGCVPVN